jgi:hypothetical protein
LIHACSEGPSAETAALLYHRIEDIFLSPSINTRYLPQTYKPPHFQEETSTFISPEIVGTIKAKPEDFVERELVSDHLGLQPEWREADLRNLLP